MIVSAPMDEAELRNLMYTAQAEDLGPFSIRYPRGQGVMVDWKTPMKIVKPGTGRKIKNGDDVAFLTIGHIGNKAVEACAELEKQGVSAAHYDLRYVKPIDEIMLHEVFGKFSKVITVEDGCIQGGMGSAVLEFMASHGYQAQVKMLGIPDKFIEHGSQEQLYTECGYNTEDLISTAKAMVTSKEGKMVG